MRTVYIFKHESGQIFICIGLFDSVNVIILLNCMKSGDFFILEKKDHQGAKEIIRSNNYSEKQIPCEVLKNMLELVERMQEAGINHSEELTNEVMKLENWLGITELVQG